MALKKSITFANGVTCDYHRIALISVDVNEQITILVRSYINEEGRDYEREYAAGKITNPIFPYTQAEYKHTDYIGSDILKGDIVESAYNWLKTQPEYTGAEDV